MRFSSTVCSFYLLPLISIFFCDVRNRRRRQAGPATTRINLRRNSRGLRLSDSETRTAAKNASVTVTVGLGRPGSGDSLTWSHQCDCPSRRRTATIAGQTEVTGGRDCRAAAKAGGPLADPWPGNQNLPFRPPGGPGPRRRPGCQIRPLLRYAPAGARAGRCGVQSTASAREYGMKRARTRIG